MMIGTALNHGTSSAGIPPNLRRTNNDPPSFRVKYDGVEIGSISKRHHHVEHRDFWSWGIDTMPLMSHGGGPPAGEARSFDQARKLFKEAFEKWKTSLPPSRLTRS
ncbi:hypothetical protein Nham_3933 [Nitrobacter hamburgensis X14]|uniref:Uncharacterized protein n=1 Tax=Nitrobacter hamburgensis (strain DSM 10229 / NCIMB 13809 / X14) TaxID=323097 RepID=Q1QGM9_NITHX|nr:hypothetical protein Nham_3933 [Nitrobacter hamburgensis X14]